MPAEKDKDIFLNFANKIGYNIGETTAENMDVQYQRGFDFMPELAMFIASYTVKKSFSRKTQAPKFIKDSICFYFKNIITEDLPVSGKRSPHKRSDPPCVHIFPAKHSFISRFKKGNHVNVVTVFLNIDYLKSFLKEDIEQFQFLFSNRHDFLIEEIMTDEILRTVNAIMNKKEPSTLAPFHYKLKALELLFYLFRSLGRREKSTHQKLNENNIDSIYKVRNKLISSLDKPSSIAELKKIAGMNELKMRNVFKQVFGLGIYEYFQHFRMKEAARLLREGRLSVSEVGYQLGFENLSHFSRIFERHIGIKPKKYSRI